MSFRGDITVDWSASPRSIEVAAPSTELKLQDLHDTLRTLAAQAGAMDEPDIITSSGKEYLDEGVYVGLTVTLLNARVKFEDRIPPWITCMVKGGNLVAMDADGDPMNPIEPAAYVNVTLAQSSSPTIVVTGSGVTEQDKLDISDRVWDESRGEHIAGSSFGAKLQRQAPSENVDDYKADVSNLALEASLQALAPILESIGLNVAFIRSISGGRWNIVNSNLICYDEGNTVEVARFSLKDKNGNPVDTSKVLIRDRVRI